MDASKLMNRDYTLVIDRSGSMDEKACPYRWISIALTRSKDGFSGRRCPLASCTE